MLSLLQNSKSLSKGAQILCVLWLKNKNQCMRYKAKLPER